MQIRLLRAHKRLEFCKRSRMTAQTILSEAGLAQVIRIDKDTNHGSVLDVIVHVSNQPSKHAPIIFERITAEKPEFTTRCCKLRINGKGKPTPVGSMETLIELVWICPGKAAKDFRSASARSLCRLLRGDLSLIPEIEQRSLALSAQQSSEVVALQSDSHKTSQTFTVLEGALAPGRLLTSYKNCVIIYLLKVGIIVVDARGVETEIFYLKFGRTEYADDRLSTHGRYFDSVKICAFFEVARSAEMETNYKNELLALNIKPGIKIKDKLHVELFELPADKTIEDMRELMRQVVESGLQFSQTIQDRELREHQRYLVDADIEKQRLALQTRQMEDAIVVRKMDLDNAIQIRQMHLDDAIQLRKIDDAKEVQLKQIEADVRVKELEVELQRLELEKIKQRQALAENRVKTQQQAPVADLSARLAVLPPVEPIPLAAEFAAEAPEVAPTANVPAAAFNVAGAAGEVPPAAAAPAAARAEDTTLPPILMNRQARRVAEINPIDKTVVMMHNKRGDVQTKYSMCIKTLKKKIEKQEPFLGRLWLEPDYIRPGHEYYDIIQRYEAIMR